MIIECQACQARFRLDESKIKGRGARVRCRRCGESILVMKEESPESHSEPAAAPLPGQFDINLAMAEPAGQGDDFIDLGIFAPPESQVAPAESPVTPDESPVTPVESPAAAEPTDAEPIVPLVLEPVRGEQVVPDSPETTPEPSPGDAVTFAEEAVTFADASPLEFEGAGDRTDLAAAEADSPSSLSFLTESPVEPAREISPSAPSTSFELDDVDMAFEQFLSGSDDAGDTGESLAAPAEPSVAPPPDMRFDLAEADTIDFSAGAPPEIVSAPAAMSGPVPDPFAFQLEEELFRAPDPSEASPFTGNTVEAVETGKPVSPPITQPPPPARQQPLPQELPVTKSVIRERRPADNREPVVRPAIAMLAILFLALTGAGGYLGFTDSGRTTLRSLAPSLGSLFGEETGNKPGGPQFDIRNLIGYYDNTVKAGRMFVIKGQVVNTGHATKGRIRIHAALLDNTNKVLADKTVYAGNVLGGENLRVADKETIEKTLSSPFGEKLANMDVAPGKSIPFMVVFLSIPDGIDAYRLEAKEGE